jgi:uncharacterized protein (DUF433 family)
MISVIGKRSDALILQPENDAMTDEQLLARVRVDSKVCAGRPYIRGTRIHIAIILDALFSGLTPAKIVEHYPSLDLDDVRAAVVYAKKLAEKNGGLAVLNKHSIRRLRLR